MSERGSALPLVVLTLTLVSVAALVLAAVTGTVVDRARAQAAADAAALAAVVEGPQAAAELAAANGAELVTARVADGVAVVEVRVGRVVARARAGVRFEREPVPAPADP
jgi:hypothetical protein